MDMVGIDLATKWIGGLVHELGHGLNAPHNRELKSLKPTLGTALMGTGNSSYGKSPTFITAAHSAIFANSQTFRTSTRSDWYSGASTKITNIKGKFEGNKIIVAGNFTSNRHSYQYLAGSTSCWSRQSRLGCTFLHIPAYWTR